MLPLQHFLLHSPTIFMKIDNANIKTNEELFKHGSIIMQVITLDVILTRSGMMSE